MGSWFKWKACWENVIGRPWLGQSVKVTLANPKHQPYVVKEVVVSWNNHILALTHSDRWLSCDRKGLAFCTMVIRFTHCNSGKISRKVQQLRSVRWSITLGMDVCCQTQTSLASVWVSVCVSVRVLFHLFPSLAMSRCSFWVNALFHLLPWVENCHVPLHKHRSQITFFPGPVPGSASSSWKAGSGFQIRTRAHNY